MQKRSHVYGPSLSKQDDWKEKAGTIAGTAPGISSPSSYHVPDWPPHLVPRPRNACCPSASSANHPPCKKSVRVLPITPAHRKPPGQGTNKAHNFSPNYWLRTRWLESACSQTPTESVKLAGYMVSSLHIRGHSAGSYAGMVWETILAEFPNITGSTVLAAIALPPSLLTRSMLSYTRQIRLIHHGDD